MQNMIPEAQYNALYLLAGGLSVEEVWAEVARYAPQGPFDTGNVVKAMERTSDRVVFVDSNDELERILEHPFAAWRIFLHPAQRKIAYAPRYAGPAQVTGGAGTGKTVTALHRAAHLARVASEELLAGEAGRSILLTTFTRNLAEALDVQFGLLVDSGDVRGQVEILNVDRLAYRVAEQARGTRPAIIDGKELAGLWADAAAKAGLPYAPTFLNREWEQVILAQDLRIEQDYLTCSRAGQGTPLGKAQRRQVWQLAQQVESELSALGRSTFLQLANEAARFLHDSGEPLYRHVIIDEAQDLHPAQWRLLRAAVPPGPDDMFIVGDAHQRIYDNHVSLAKVGINVRGRSRRLTVNYRTTQEILALAVPALGKAPVTGLDDEADSLTGYRSPLHGRRPEVHAAAVTRGGTGRACRAGARVDRRGHRAARDRHCRPRRVHGRAGRRHAEGRGHPGHLPHGQVGERRGPCRHDASHERAGVPGGRGHRRRRRGCPGASRGHASRDRSARPRAGSAARAVPAVRRLHAGAGPPVRLLQRLPEPVPRTELNSNPIIPNGPGCPFDPRSATAGHPCHPLDLPNFTSRPRNASASPRRNCSWNAWLRKFRRQP